MKTTNSILALSLTVTLCTSSCTASPNSLGGDQGQNGIGVGVLAAPSALHLAAAKLSADLAGAVAVIGAAAVPAAIGIWGMIALSGFGASEAQIEANLSAALTEALRSGDLSEGWLAQTITQHMTEATDLEKGMFYASFVHEIGPATLQQMIVTTMGNNLEAVGGSVALFDAALQSLAAQHGAEIASINLNLAGHDTVSKIAGALASEADLALRSIANVSLQASGASDNITARNTAISQTYEVFIAQMVTAAATVVANETYNDVFESEDGDISYGGAGEQNSAATAWDYARGRYSDDGCQCKGTKPTCSALSAPNRTQYGFFWGCNPASCLAACATVWTIFEYMGCTMDPFTELRVRYHGCDAPNDGVTEWEVFSQ